jgi:translation initiation factor IF-3
VLSRYRFVARNQISLDSSLTSRIEQHHASFSTTAFTLAARRQFGHKKSTSNGKKSLPADHEIDSQFVHVVSPDGSLSPALTPRSILDTLDQTNETLQIVSFPPQNPAPGQPRYPIAKILSRKAVRESMLAAAKADKARRRTGGSGAPTTKTLEINWGIDNHDLSHRLERMRGFLEKGWRVDVELAPRKRKRRATTEECREILRKIQQVVVEADAREMAPMEGTAGAVAKLTFEGMVIAPRPENEPPHASGGKQPKGVSTMK